MPAGTPDTSPGRGYSRRNFLRAAALGTIAELTGVGPISMALRGKLGPDIAHAQEITPTETPFPLPEFALDANTELSSALDGMLNDTERTSPTPIDVPLSINISALQDPDQSNFYAYDQNTPLGQRLTNLLGNLNGVLNDGARGAIDFNARVENGVITNVAPYIRLTADYQNEAGLQFLADSTLALDSEGGLHYQIPIPGIADTERGRTSSVRPIRLDDTTYPDYISFMRQEHPEFITQEAGTLIMGQVVQESGARQGRIAVAIAENHPVGFIDGFSEVGANVRAEPTPTANPVGRITRSFEPVMSAEDRAAFQQLYPNTPANYDAPVVYAQQADVETNVIFTWYGSVDHGVSPLVYGFTRSDVSPLNINGPVAPAISPLRVAEYRAPVDLSAAEAGLGGTIRTIRTLQTDFTRTPSLETLLGTLPAELSPAEIQNISRLQYPDGTPVSWADRMYFNIGGATRYVAVPGLVRAVTPSDSNPSGAIVIDFPVRGGTNRMVYQVDSIIINNPGDTDFTTLRPRNADVLGRWRNTNSSVTNPITENSEEMNFTISSTGALFEAMRASTGQMRMFIVKIPNPDYPWEGNDRNTGEAVSAIARGDALPSNLQLQSFFSALWLMQF